MLDTSDSNKNGSFIDAREFFGTFPDGIKFDDDTKKGFATATFGSFESAYLFKRAYPLFSVDFQMTLSFNLDSEVLFEDQETSPFDGFGYRPSVQQSVN